MSSDPITTDSSDESEIEKLKQQSQMAIDEHESIETENEIDKEIKDEQYSDFKTKIEILNQTSKYQALECIFSDQEEWFVISFSATTNAADPQGNEIDIRSQYGFHFSAGNGGFGGKLWAGSEEENPRSKIGTDQLIIGDCRTLRWPEAGKKFLKGTVASEGVLYRVKRAFEGFHLTGFQYWQLNMKSFWKTCIIFLALFASVLAYHHHQQGSNLAHILAAGLIVQMLSHHGHHKQHHHGHHHHGHHHHGHESRHNSGYALYKHQQYRAPEWPVQEARIQPDLFAGQANSWIHNQPMNFGFPQGQFPHSPMEAFNVPSIYSQQQQPLFPPY
ncbi:hypothetical protein HNY73_020164 [Argiope bruennichi]|uniref:Uncharacterized protein n=1 Tax=Argiope bruennichi TaxID=94029 RepID=A0A8T0E5W9_ARGBR|nr:hypothetical protein HNY73_020164 [Argiope bruennichi]